jgi:hypothetical protein
MTNKVQDGKHWVQLFNGKDLDNWTDGDTGGKPDPEKWRVEDGVLILSGQPGLKLLSNRSDYKNLHFRMEGKLREAALGLVFRSRQKPFKCQCECHIASPGVYLYPPMGASIMHSGIGGGKVDSKEVIVKSGEWFTAEVIIYNDHITLQLNGKTILEVIDKNNVSGCLGFMFYHGTVQIRKSEVMELPSPL